MAAIVRTAALTNPNSLASGCGHQIPRADSQASAHTAPPNSTRMVSRQPGTSTWSVGMAAAQPTQIEGRRQMPQFNLTEQELNDLADFLEWTSRIKTQNWPPNDAG